MMIKHFFNFFLQKIGICGPPYYSKENWGGGGGLNLVVITRKTIVIITILTKEVKNFLGL